MSDELKRKIFESSIEAVLLSNKGESTVREFEKGYNLLNGENVPLKKFGYSSMEALLDELQQRSIINLRRNADGLLLIEPIPSEKTKHMRDLVQNTKGNKKKNGNSSMGDRRPQRGQRNTDRDRRHFDGHRIQPNYTNPPKNTRETPLTQRKDPLTKDEAHAISQILIKHGKPMPAYDIEPIYKVTYTAMPETFRWWERGYKNLNELLMDQQHGFFRFSVDSGKATYFVNSPFTSKRESDRDLSRYVTEPIPYSHLNRYECEEYHPSAVGEVFSPDEFYLILGHEDLTQMRRELKSTYHGSKLESMVVDERHLTSGLPVAARYDDGFFYRCIIEKVSFIHKKAHVLAVDHGTEFIVDFSKLFYLTHDLHKYQCCAFRTFLADIAPMGETWSLPDCQHFVNMVVNQILYVNILPDSDGVTLHLTGDEESINQRMCCDGYAALLE